MEAALADCIPVKDAGIWLAIGLLGQALFSARFLIQWLYSEKMRQSLIPNAFWYFSILGSMVLLSYAIYKRDPVFILGQSFGFIVYFRNLYLLHKNKRQDSTVVEPKKKESTL